MAEGQLGSTACPVRAPSGRKTRHRFTVNKKGKLRQADHMAVVRRVGRGGSLGLETCPPAGLLRPVSQTGPGLWSACPNLLTLAGRQVLDRHSVKVRTGLTG